MTWNASTSRSSRGFRVMNMRPLFEAELPTPVPRPIAIVATAGSCMTMAPACSCSLYIAGNDTSCPASVVPNRMPVSCCGKKPLGMMTKR